MPADPPKDAGRRKPSARKCPVCGKPCKAHDFGEFTWRHLNFFQHHCYITAKIPRTDCGEHGVLRMTAPWAREGSRFTLLFEQAALMLVREMPVLAAARIIEGSPTSGCGASLSTMSPARSSAPR